MFSLGCSGTMNQRGVQLEREKYGKLIQIDLHYFAPIRSHDDLPEEGFLPIVQKDLVVKLFFMGLFWWHF